MSKFDLIIVSGASKGIGRNILDNLMSKSKNLIGIGSSEKILELGRNALRADLSDYDATYYRTKEIVDKIAPKTLGIVLCAATLGENGGIFDADFHNWSKLYSCNVLGNLAIIKACQQHIEKGKTRIVFLSGGGAATGYPDFSGYALSKVAVVRAVENIGMEFAKHKYDASIIALAPGAVNTEMLAKVIEHGGEVKTKTDISEPTAFVHKFLADEFDSKSLNGRFLHCRDNINEIDFNKKDMRKLRRIE